MADTPNDKNRLKLWILQQMYAVVSEDGGELPPDLMNAWNAASPAANPPQSLSRGDELNLKLRKLSWPDAVLAYLQSSAQPQTGKQIWAAMKKAGRQSDAAKPWLIVTDTLKTLLLTHEDLFHVRWGSWHLKSKYRGKNKEKLQKLLDRNKGPAISREEISARTKAGIEAWRANGGKPGAKTKMTPEKIEEAKSLLETGLSVTKVAERLGVSTGSLYAHELAPKKLKTKSDAKAQQDLELRSGHVRLVASKD